MNWGFDNMKYWERIGEMTPKFEARERKYNWELNKDQYPVRTVIEWLRGKLIRFDISRDVDDLEDIIAYALMLYDKIDKSLAQANEE